MSVASWVHRRFVYNRRMAILADKISALLPKNAKVLDVGCGDGKIDLLITQKRPDIKILGIDVLVRKNTYIPVTAFDGGTIPFDSGSFDAVIFIDVLHHTEDPERLLSEGKRVSKDVIAIKDHIQKSSFDRLILRLMDWVGNKHHGVTLPYNYWTECKWQDVFTALNLSVHEWDVNIGLYPPPMTYLFDRSLHFIAGIKIR